MYTTRSINKANTKPIELYFKTKLKKSNFCFNLHCLCQKAQRDSKIGQTWYLKFENCQINTLINLLMC